MENQNKLSPEETDELRKSLEALDMSPEEIEDFIQKANKSDEKEESQETEKPKEEGEGSESTIAEKAEEAKEDDNKEPEVKDEKPAIEKAVEEEDLEKACSALKMQQAEIQKSIDEMEAKMGKKKEPVVEKSIENDFEKSFGQRFEDIEKSLFASMEERFAEQSDIIKGLQDELAEAKKEIKVIGDTPIPTKSIVSSATFFEKGQENEFGGEPKVLSISRDRDDLLKGMTDMLQKSTDQDIKTMLENGISDYTINKTPTGHGISALAFLARKNNITLEQ